MMVYEHGLLLKVPIYDHELMGRKTNAQKQLS